MVIDKIIKCAMGTPKTTVPLMKAAKSAPENMKLSGVNPRHPGVVVYSRDGQIFLVGHATSSDYYKIQGDDAEVVYEVKDKNGFSQQRITVAKDYEKPDVVLSNTVHPSYNISTIVIHPTPTCLTPKLLEGFEPIPANERARNMLRSKGFEEGLKNALKINDAIDKRRTELASKDKSHGKDNDDALN
jgi:hypothetical protein